MAGLVIAVLNGESVFDKPGEKIPDDTELKKLKGEKLKYVSRGGRLESLGEN